MITRQIVDAINDRKTFSVGPIWEDDGAYHSCRLALQVRNVGIAGLFARIKIPNTIDAYRTLVQLEFDGPNLTYHLERLDWKVGHTNPNKGPVELRLASMASTHYHSFKDNFVEVESRMMQKNLPIARPVDPDPGSLEEFFEVAESQLKIEGLARITRPPFQAGLF